MRTVRRRSQHARQLKKKRSKRSNRSMVRVERLESRLLLASDWQNAAAPLDVNHDAFISSADALSVINDLNLHGVRSLGARAEAEGGGPTEPSIDVNGDGSASPVDVLAVINFLNGEGENGAFIQFRSAAFNAAGTEEITSLGLGEEAIVKVFVSDVRMAGRAGVFSAYLDIDYDPSLVEVVPNAFTQLDLATFEEVPVTIMDNQDQYGQGRSGDTSTAGVIDGVGSFSSSLAPLGPTERELFKFKVRAIGEGTVTFVGSPTTEAVGDPGQSPTLDAGLYNSDNPVCPSAALDPASNQPICRGEMMFVNSTLVIAADIVAMDDSFTVDEDSGASDPFDVLSNDTANVGTVNLASFTPASSGDVVRNANDTFTYTPSADFFGSDSFTYTINNGLGTDSTATVSITVDPINDAPILTVPEANTTDEDTLLGLSGVSVADVDADAGSGVEVSLFVSDGTLTLASSSATVTGDGTGAPTITGFVADVNTALGGLTYSPDLDFNGSDSLSVTVFDNGNFGGGDLSDSGTVDITINPINDGPVNVIPGPQTVFNTETLAFTNNEFQVLDVDAATIEVNLTVGQGTIALGSTGGLEVTGDNSTSLTATGPISAINTALNGLLFDPIDGFIGSDTLTMTTSDLGGTGAGGPLTDTDTVSISITPPEVPFAASDLFVIEEDSPATQFDVLFNDLRPEPMTENTLTITRLNGELISTTPSQTTPTGGSVSFDNGTFTYTPAPDYYGSDTFTYTIESSPNVGDGPSTGTVDIEIQPINDGPINSVPGALSIDEDNTLIFSGLDALSVDDIDAGDDGLTVTLTVSNGMLNVSGTGGSVANNGTSSLTLDGTVSQVNDRLSSLSYSPLADFAGIDALTIDTTDNGHTGGVTGDPTANSVLSDLDTVNITVQPINDGPIIVVPGQQSFITDFDNLLSSANDNAITIDDVDAGSDDVQVDLTIGDGTLTLSDTSSLSSISGNGTNSLTATGSVANINAALGAGLNYRTGDSGNRTLSATVNDLGSNGGIAGDPNAVNPLSATGDVAVEVLDFVPSNIGGFVFVDSNANGYRDAERGLEGVKVTLSGIDAITGNEITPITVTTTSDGRYDFANLRPGFYSFGTETLPHFLSSTPTFESPVSLIDNTHGAVTIDVRESVNSLTNDFPVLGLNGTFFDGIHHQTVLNPPDGELYNNILFAIDATDPANTSTVVSYQGNWGGYDQARVVLSPDGQAATITVREIATGNHMSTTLTFLSGLFRVRSIGGLTTVRAFVTPSMMNGGSSLDANAVDEIMRPT